MARVLIVDDDVSFCIMLKAFLQKHGYNATEVFSYNEALKQLQGQMFDVVLTDFRLPEKSGLDLLREVRQMQPMAVVILMTAYADIKTAVTAIKQGAFEYVAKPVNPDEILMNIKNGLLRQQAGATNGSAAAPRKNGKLVREFVYISGKGKESRVIHDHIDLVSPTDMSVIIQGESGTGKEYVARQIHQKSQRKAKPFVAIDCGALSKELAGSEFFGHVKGSFTGAITDKTGQFEAANGGTLFLDEIGNLSYEIQVKLLRAIQERKIRRIGSNRDMEVDVRLIAASNEDLQAAVQKGSFREDLYHRLNEFSIKVPALRERKEDIMLFARHFLEQANEELCKKVTDFSEDVTMVFMRYPWPGNIRELKNVMKRSVLLSREAIIQLESLPSEIAAYKHLATQTEQATGDDLKSQTEKTEKEIILSTLQKARYNKSKAAKLLNIDRKTLYNKIRQYGIELD